LDHHREPAPEGDVVTSRASLLDEPEAVDQGGGEPPHLDQCAERELDPVSPVLLQMGVLLRQVDHGRPSRSIDLVDLPESGAFEGAHLVWRLGMMVMMGGDIFACFRRWRVGTWSQFLFIIGILTLSQGL